MNGQKDQPIRICYQSFVDPAEQRPYVDRLPARLAQIASAGVPFDVMGLVPADRYFHSVADFLGGIAAAAATA
jgi:allantoin racemase